MTHEYNITGMTCQQCVVKVKSELLKLGDVLSADIQLESPQATITMSKHIPIIELQQVINKAGHYTISESAQVGGETYTENGTEEKNSYFPIFLIFGFITGVTVVIQIIKGSFAWMQWMTHFMAGFFLVFSFFKLLNLKGFSEGYSTYDVIAKRFYKWGYIYPFVELSLGIAFLTGVNSLITATITLVVLAISSIGVIQSLLRKTKFQCACLGTVIKLPLSKVTLFEDLLMMTMSGIMIAVIF